MPIEEGNRRRKQSDEPLATAACFLSDKKTMLSPQIHILVLIRFLVYLVHIRILFTFRISTPFEGVSINYKTKIFEMKSTR